MSDLKNIKKVYHNLSVDAPFQLFVSGGGGPASSFSGDMHYDLQLCVVLSGAMDMRYSGFETCVESGDVWWTSCWEPHESRAARADTSFVVATMSLEALGSPDIFHETDWARPFFLPPESRPRAKSGPVRAKCLAVGRELAELEKTKPPAFRTLQWMRIHELIIALLLDGGAPAADKSGKPPDTLRILPAIQLVKGASDRPPSLEEAAAACGMGRSRFSGMFSSAMGVSFGKFAMRARVSTAARLLRSTTLPVKDISKRCGFLDLSHFYHAFRRYFRRSPARFRES